MSLVTPTGPAVSAVAFAGPAAPAVGRLPGNGANTRLAVIVLLLLLGLPARAQDTGYLRYMPSPADVFAAYQDGADEIDRAARQQAAFGFLSDTVGHQARDRQLTPEERKLQNAYSFDAETQIRQRLGFRAIGCDEGDDACRRFEALTEQYLHSGSFRLEFRTRFFQGREHLLPSYLETTEAEAAAWVFGRLIPLAVALAVAVVLVRPWRVHYRGRVESLGSGVVGSVDTGLFAQFSAVRDHLAIGGIRLDGVTASFRMDDALVAAGEHGDAAVVGIGWYLWRRWPLCLRTAGGSLRESVFSFLFHGFILQPFVFALAAVVAGLAVGLLTDASYGVVAGLFFAGLYLAQAFGNIRAWLGGKP